ncbi:MAG: hypothetical protein ACXIUL_13515 [Wenzhouxiangella sp.]
MKKGKLGKRSFAAGLLTLAMLWLGLIFWSSSDSDQSADSAMVEVDRAASAEWSPDTSERRKAVIDQVQRKESPGAIQWEGEDDAAEFDPIPDRAAVLIRVARARSAGELADLVEVAQGINDSELVSKIRSIEDAICGQLIRSEVDARTVRSNAGWSRWQQFCHDARLPAFVELGISGHTFLEQLDNVMAEQAERLDELLERLPMEEAFIALLREAEHPFQINAIALMGVNDWWVLNLPHYFQVGPRLLDGDSVQAIQAMALDFYACERFDHCGPDTATSISLCLDLPECQPDDTYLDLIAWLNSPAHREIAERLVEEIRRWRSPLGP